MTFGTWCSRTSVGLQRSKQSWRANIEEIKDLLGFLSGLYAALDQLSLNRRQPIVTVRKFSLPPKDRWDALSPDERVYAEGHEVLRMVSVSDPEEQ